MIAKAICRINHRNEDVMIRKAMTGQAERIEETKSQLREAMAELSRMQSKMERFIEQPFFGSIPAVVSKAAEIERLMARLAAETQAFGMMQLHAESP